MKNDGQPIRDSVPWNSRCTKDPCWLNIVFLFSTEIWAEQLKKAPYTNKYTNKAMTSQVGDIFHLFVQQYKEPKKAKRISGAQCTRHMAETPNNATSEPSEMGEGSMNGRRSCDCTLLLIFVFFYIIAIVQTRQDKNLMKRESESNIELVKSIITWKSHFHYLSHDIKKGLHEGQQITC